jgi:hypothetical protein
MCPAGYNAEIRKGWIRRKEGEILEIPKKQKREIPGRMSFSAF